MNRKILGGVAASIIFVIGIFSIKYILASDRHGKIKSQQIKPVKRLEIPSIKPHVEPYKAKPISKPIELKNNEHEKTKFAEIPTNYRIRIIQFSSQLSAIPEVTELESNEHEKTKSQKENMSNKAISEPIELKSNVHENTKVAEIPKNHRIRLMQFSSQLSAIPKVIELKRNENEHEIEQQEKLIEKIEFPVKKSQPEPSNEQPKPQIIELQKDIDARVETLLKNHAHKTRRNFFNPLPVLINYRKNPKIIFTKPPLDNIYLYKRDIPNTKKIWEKQQLSFGYGNKKNCCFPGSFDKFKTNYEPIKILGQGSYGKVFKIKTHCCGGVYAMKVMDLDPSLPTFNEEFCNEEVYFAKYFQLNPLPHVVKSHHVYYEDKLYILYELLDNKFLLRKSFSCMNYNKKYVKKFVQSLFLAIAVLHKHNIVHCDIKINNICIDKKSVVKLIDFGISNKLDSGYTTMNRMLGTSLYMPPENLSGKTPMSFSSDWWAFGVTLYTLLEGSYPYRIPNLDNFSKFKYIKESLFINKFRGIHNYMINNDLKDLIKRLLDPNPNTRLGVGKNATNDILRHPYFKGKKLEKFIEKY